jgi:DNA gyrase/topoisomerase IV subunit B
MLDAGRVFAAIPPLHRIETMGAGGKKGEYIYTYSDDEMKKVTADLKSRASVGKSLSSVTKASVRWMQISSAKPRWTLTTALCDVSLSPMQKRPRRCLNS